MNKVLAQKVKDKCKDMGLSEDYVNGITEVLGADITDDSTDETAIENVANLIADVARRSQGEATRWAQKRQPQTPPTPPAPPQPTPPTPSKGEPDWAKQMRESLEQRMSQLEQQNATLIAERKHQERSSKINAAFVKFNIPEYLREFVSVPDDVDDTKIEEFVGGMSQKLVAQQLPGMETSGRQVASKEETAAAAENFFKTHVQPKKD
jgi:hypothetical protein